ncbi:hypothetical protein J5N97_022612 [Dioscorea zingiberensis]|uniref:Uncharacterized protein n=1 Tax=Dioscorea zingiberensis TaxID=325984 RepID=A0A9D5HB23_9LILI|nr:hypothetical protein J5N97_022612 [Dioscorea zingiberensis]
MLGQHSSNKSSNNSEETRGPKEEDSKEAIDTDSESRTSDPRCSPPPSDDRKKRGIGGIVEASQGEWGRERLKRHRRMTTEEGQVGIPDEWSQETLLGSWIDCSAFQTSYAPTGLAPARRVWPENASVPPPPLTSTFTNHNHIQKG